MQRTGGPATKINAIVSLINRPKMAHVDDFARCGSTLERVTKADHAYDGVLLAKYLERTRQKPRLPISGNGIEKHKAAKLNGCQHWGLKNVGEDSIRAGVREHRNTGELAVTEKADAEAR